MGQVPMIPLQPHPVPVGRQGGCSVVDGTANFPQGQAASENGTNPPHKGQAEGTELQLPQHGYSNQPPPPPQFRPHCLSAHSWQHSAPGRAVVCTCATARVRLRQTVEVCVTGVFCIRLIMEKLVLWYLRKTESLSGWRREILVFALSWFQNKSLSPSLWRNKDPTVPLYKPPVVSLSGCVLENHYFQLLLRMPQSRGGLSTLHLIIFLY